MASEAMITAGEAIDALSAAITANSIHDGEEWARHANIVKKYALQFLPDVPDFEVGLGLEVPFGAVRMTCPSWLEKFPFDERPDVWRGVMTACWTFYIYDDLRRQIAHPECADCPHEEGKTNGE